VGQTDSAGGWKIGFRMITILSNEVKLQRKISLPITAPDLNSEFQLPRMIPQLDRLRGLAILLVLVCHAASVFPHWAVPVASQGWIGVDLFFVLSGFLITGILWDSREKPGYFVSFYGRRILRIWPAYIILLAFAFFLLPIAKRIVGGPALEFPSETLGLWPYLVMIQNLFSKALMASAVLNVTWSLAIEEQFYVVWPAFIRYVPWRAALPFLVASILAAPLLRIWAMHQGYPQLAIYMNPLTHGDGLLCGAVAAIWLRIRKLKRRHLLVAGVALMGVGMAIFVPICPAIITSQYCHPLVFTATALSSTGLLLVALVSENTGRTLHRRLFMNRIIAFFGYISYSLYLYHSFIFRFAVSEKLAARLDVWHYLFLTRCLMALCGVGLSVLLAWISRVTIEMFALSKKHFFGYSRRA
jgi:peptidoglycan/LPS O-acetylase OafA/YrhL